MITNHNTYQGTGLLQISHDLNRWLTYLLFITIFSFLLGIITFGEPFSFYHHAYSYFGRIRTPNGNSNAICFVIFSIGLVLSALVCFRLDKILQGGYNHNLFKACGTGYMLMLVPCDIYNPVHMMGASMVFFSLWFFTVIRLVQLISYIGIFKFIVYQLILQGTVIPYAFMYAFDSPVKQAVQKIALFGLIATLKVSIVEFRKWCMESLQNPES